MLKIKQQGSTSGVVALSYGLAPYVDKCIDMKMLYEKVFDSSVDTNLSYVGIIPSVHVMRLIARLFMKDIKEWDRFINCHPTVVEFKSEKEMDYKIRCSLRENKRIVIACCRKGKGINIMPNSPSQQFQWITIYSREKGNYKFLDGITSEEASIIHSTDLYNSNTKLNGYYDFKKYHRSILPFGIGQNISNLYIKEKIDKLSDRCYDIKLEVDMSGVYLEI